MPTHAALGEFHPQTRDLYVPAGDIGMWQGALRNPEDPVRAATAEAIDAHQALTVELLYTDQIGRQRTIVRLNLLPAADSWLAIAARYWYLDWDGPRPESDVLRAAETIEHEQEAAERRASATDERSTAGDEMPASAGEMPRAADAGGVGGQDGAAEQAGEANATQSSQAGPTGERS
jgi:hypothetical protein